MSDDIRILWERVLADDRAAWAAVVRRYAALVYTVAVRAGLEPSDAEDCGQQVWLALYRTRGHVRDPERLPSWLIQTTRRRAIRMRQQQAARVRTEAEPIDVDPVRLPEEEVLRLEESVILEAALARLEPRCRSLVRALFFSPHTHTYAQVAESLGLSANALGPLRSRCLKRLKRILEELGYGAD